MLSIPGCGRLAVVVVIVCFPIVLYFVKGGRSRDLSHREGGGGGLRGITSHAAAFIPFKDYNWELKF